MKMLGALVAAGLMATSGVVAANQPDAPGCFGKDRASILQTTFIGNKEGKLTSGADIGLNQEYLDAPGASAWGEIAGDRAETNGAMNRAYKTSCGGDPE